MTRLGPALCALALATTAGAADFVGAETCKACHAEAYEAWKKSRHATADQSLVDTQRKDGRCIQCHDRDAARGVTAVSCETCHGAGQYYVAPYVMRDSELARAVGLEDSAARACKLCHDATAPSLRAQDPLKMLERIKHWSDETAAPVKVGWLMRALR